MTNTKKATKNTFAPLLREYEKQARNRTSETETEYTKALQDLATACTYSVLKKLCNVGGVVTEQTKSTSDTAKTIRTLRQTLTKDLKTLDRIAYTSEHATALEYNQDGELQTVIKDKHLNETFEKLCAETFSGDGLDLVNTAVIAIMTETEKHTDLSTDFMEVPYTVRRLKRKVYIHDVNSLGGYETTETTSIQEIYKAIRRQIEQSRSMQVANHKYTYIADTLTDTESDTETEIYRRLPKYSGLAYEQTDINGKVTAITADNETTETTDKIISMLTLSKQQATILQLRQSGYGYKAIATYMSIDIRNVLNQVKRIQQKALTIGLTPTK